MNEFQYKWQVGDRFKYMGDVCVVIPKEVYTTVYPDETVDGFAFIKQDEVDQLDAFDHIPKDLVPADEATRQRFNDAKQAWLSEHAQQFNIGDWVKAEGGKIGQVKCITNTIDCDDPLNPKVAIHVEFNHGIQHITAQLLELASAEEVKKSKGVYGLEKDDICYVLWDDGDILDITWHGNHQQIAQRKQGNIFMTREDAEFIRDERERHEANRRRGVIPF